MAPPELYASRRDAEQYAAWAGYLEDQLRQGGHTVARTEAQCMLSSKNILITARKVMKLPLTSLCDSTSRCVLAHGCG